MENSKLTFCIIYGSTTGLTEMAAEEVQKGIVLGLAEKLSISEDEAEKMVSLKNVLETNIGEIENYDFIVLGCSTWDYGCLQYDFEPFHEEMKNYDLSGKKFAIFGTGDKSYGDSYCEALRILEATIKDKGGILIAPNLDIECDLTDERLRMVREWGKKLSTSLDFE